VNIKQISVFLENRKGRLAEVTDVMAKANMNIRALSLADTADFGILRVIVNDPDTCLKVLKEHGFIVQETDVIAVEVPDRPGGLNHIMHVLDQDNINVEYMYATVEKNKDNAIVIFKIDDQQKAVDILRKNNIPVMRKEALKGL